MPRKLVPILSVLVASLLALIIMTAVAVLGNLSQPSADIRIEDLESGRLGGLLTGPTLWSQFPNFPPLAALFDTYAACVAIGMTVVICCLMRDRLRDSLHLVSVVVLCSASVPYLIGWIELQAWAHDPVAVGAWVAFMLLGAGYCCVTAAFLAVLDLMLARSGPKGVAQPEAINTSSGVPQSASA